MAFIGILLFLNLLWINNVIAGYKLVVDHDGGADDAMAILIALMREKYFDGPEVIALTTTFGNVNETQAFVNSQKILDLADRRDVAIYRGSNSPFIEGIETDSFFGADGLGVCGTKYNPIPAQPVHAAQALVDLSKLYEGDLIIVALGPLTNIALAMKVDPGFLRRLSVLYVASGYIQNPNKAEFNAAMDPEAYYVVIKDANPDQVTLVPSTQIHEYLTITKEWRQSTLGAIPTKTIESLNCFERLSLVNSTKWVRLDPAVMSLALDSKLVRKVKYSKNSIDLCGAKRGVTPFEFTAKSEADVKVIYSANKEKYQEFLLNTFSAELRDT